MFIEEMKKGDILTDIVMAVVKAEKKTTASQTPYWDLVLQDRTGTVSGKIWSPNCERHETMEEGVAYVVKSAVVDAYNNNPQLKITHMVPIDRELTTDEMASLVPVGDEPVDAIMADILELVDTIKNDGLRMFCLDVLADHSVDKGYRTLPGGTGMHHAYVGGLAKHVRDVMRRVAQACDLQPGLDRDILVAGALVHDIGKIDELSAGITFSYTDAGNFIGHIPLGVSRLTQMLKKSDVAMDDKIHLLHMVVSHHGKLEWGSPKLPATPEAFLLAEMDVIDARMDNIQGLMDGKQESGQYNRAFERHMHILGNRTGNRE